MVFTPPIALAEKIKPSPQEECEAGGWIWNEELQSCDNPNVQPIPEALKKERPPQVSSVHYEEAYVDNKQGRVYERDNKSFIIPPKDAEALSAKNELVQSQQRQEAQISAQEQFVAMQRKVSIAKQIGLIDFATAQSLEEEGIDVGQAIAAGLQNVVPSALGFGAAAGGAGLLGGPAAPVTAPAAAAIGVGVGSITGFYKGVTQNIKDQRTDLVTTKTKELKQRKASIMNYISAANANPAGALDMVHAFNVEKSLIMRDYNTLVKRGNEDLNFWGSDATPQIVEYNVFFDSMLPSLELRMQEAVAKPDPTRAYIDLGDQE